MSEAENAPLLSQTEEQALACVLDEIVPARDDGSLPGAGELGLTRHLTETMRGQPDLHPSVRRGLAALDAWARAAGGSDFASLARPQRLEALNALAAAEPGFLPGLIFHTYVGYYRDDRVLEALGLEARPPFPQGYALEPGDLSRLDAVRRRKRIYREC